MIACQLQTTNNTVGALFNDASGIYDGCKVYKYNAANGLYSNDVGDSQGSSYANGWDGGGVLTMNPGEAIWFQNAATSNLVVTFVGTVPQGTNTITLKQGFQMISSPVPFSGDLVTNMGLTNYNDQTQVYVWNNPAPGFPHGNYTTSVVDLQGGSKGYMSQWDSPDPVLSVGQGFWYKSGPGTQTPWVQVFSINP
jgi:hypothetical protein